MGELGGLRELGVLGRLKERRLSARMRKEAVGLGLCGKWQEKWTKDTDVDGMLDMFVDGQDFCIKHDWPSVDVLKKYGGGRLRAHGVYADEEFEARNVRTVIAVGGCKGMVTADDRQVTTVYARHGSKVRIEAKGEARVFVMLYDEAGVEVESKDNARVFVYRHGKKTFAMGKVFKIMEEG